MKNIQQLQGNMGGKIAGFLGGGGFGSKSSKNNNSMNTIVEGMEGAAVNGGLSMAQLEEHTKRMAEIHEEGKGGYDSD